MSRVEQLWAISVTFAFAFAFYVVWALAYFAMAIANTGHPPYVIGVLTGAIAIASGLYRWRLL